ncbi:MAG: hypothetical protein J7497_14045, partial [Chitinophagaceae bacterium]|nr:hypothetical protein [Chitinophagaceae bacterium]
RAAFGNSKFSFGNNNYALNVSQTSRFMEGEYEYCYEVDISDSKASTLPPIYENCFVYQLQPRTPMLLISPVDGDVFCNKRPQFIWQPSLPALPNTRFRLVLAPIRNNQDIVEALTFNPPLINQSNIAGNSLFYPVNVPELQEGQLYVWQVIAYQGQTILSRSEVWVFTHQCKDDKRDTIDGSYRELKEVSEGDFYIAQQYLRFSYINPYSSGELNYEITNLSDPSSSVKRLPKFKMESGLNKHEIDLFENSSFKEDDEYLLRVKLANNRILALRFIYKN